MSIVINDYGKRELIISRLDHVTILVCRYRYRCRYCCRCLCPPLYSSRTPCCLWRCTFMPWSSRNNWQSFSSSLRGGDNSKLQLLLLLPVSSTLLTGDNSNYNSNYNNSNTLQWKKAVDTTRNAQLISVATTTTTTTRTITNWSSLNARQAVDQVPHWAVERCHQSSFAPLMMQCVSVEGIGEGRGCTVL